MNKTAIVNRTEETQIFLMHITDYGKKEQTEREFWNIKKLDFKADNPKSFDLSEGDAVEYHIPEGKTILASFIVLIFPILAFLITFKLLSLTGIQSEKIKALISVLVMISSFNISKFFKKIGIKETLPVITKIITKENLNKIKTECKDCGSCTACK